MDIRYKDIGICGLSCKLCSMYHTKSESRCFGCKSEKRMKVGCPFITCAVKKKDVEFCWDCVDNKSCEKWKNHREYGENYDTFKCYQKLEDDINFIQDNGVSLFEKQQNQREVLLKEMLNRYNEGRSKSYYCIAATVFSIDELDKALEEANIISKDVEDVRARSKILHSILDKVANEKGYLLKLRKNK